MGKRILIRKTFSDLKFVPFHSFWASTRILIAIPVISRFHQPLQPPPVSFESRSLPPYPLPDLRWSVERTKYRKSSSLSLCPFELARFEELVGLYGSSPRASPLVANTEWRQNKNLPIGIKRWRKKGSPCDAFLLLRDNAEYFLLLFLWGIDKVMRRHGWWSLEGWGSPYTFIYTPAFTVSLASKKNRPKLLSIRLLRCPLVLYFLLFQIQSSINSKETNIKMLSGDGRN